VPSCARASVATDIANNVNTQAVMKTTRGGWCFFEHVAICWPIRVALFQ
jgi:hypothetical protein